MNAADVHNLMRYEWILLKELAHCFLVESFNNDEQTGVVRVRPPEYDSSIRKKLIHECRVFSPARLLAAGFARYPGRAGRKNDREGLFHNFTLKRPGRLRCRVVLVLVLVLLKRFHAAIQPVFRATTALVGITLELDRRVTDTIFILQHVF